MTREPVAIVTLVCIVVIVLFGMFRDMDPVNIAILVGIVTSGGALARSQVTPTAAPVANDGSRLVKSTTLRGG